MQETRAAQGWGFALDHRQSTPGLLSMAPLLPKGGPAEGGKHRSPRRVTWHISGLALALHLGLFSGRPPGEAQLFAKESAHQLDLRAEEWHFCVLPPVRAPGRGSHKATWQGDQGQQASTAPLLSSPRVQAAIPRARVVACCPLGHEALKAQREERTES